MLPNGSNANKPKRRFPQSSLEAPRQRASLPVTHEVTWLSACQQTEATLLQLFPEAPRQRASSSSDVSGHPALRDDQSSPIDTAPTRTLFRWCLKFQWCLKSPCFRISIFPNCIRQHHAAA